MNELAIKACRVRQYLVAARNDYRGLFTDGLILASSADSGSYPQYSHKSLRYFTIV